MVRVRQILAAVLAALAMVGASWRAHGADDFKAKLDDAAAKLAAYDFGSPNAALNTITELVASSYGKPAQRKELAGKLAAVLGTPAPRGAKDFVCRQLSIIGTADEVPALAALLADEHLSHMARYAVERIPGPAADEALRQALGTVKGKLLVGMINSLGNRRDAQAIADLGKLLADPDPAVAGAAAAALGKIGPAAGDLLAQALPASARAVRPIVADACLLVADRLVAQGKRDEAAAIYDHVGKTDLPRAQRIAAARGAVVARQAAGAALLVAQLQGSDADLFALSLHLLREMPGEEITKAAAAALGALPAEKKIAVLQALADRGCKAAAPAVTGLAQSGDVKVRVVALSALTRVADASAVPLLLATAAGGEADVAPAALAALAALPGKEVDAAVAATIDKPDAKLRRVAIDVAGQRRVGAAIAALIRAAADPDNAIRAAAVKALGDTVTVENLPAVIELVVKAKAAELAAAEAALRAAALRAADRDACAAAIASGLGQADAPAKAALLRTIGQVGGEKALEAVRAARKEASEPIRDTAISVLANWPDAAAMPELAEVAKTSDSRKHKILALRGYLRLITESKDPAAKKLQQCQEAMGLAQRDDEKKMVLGALGSVDSPQALTLVVSYLDGPMADEAAAAALTIGERMVQSNAAAVAQAMKKVQAGTQNKTLQKRAADLLGRAGGK